MTNIFPLRCEGIFDPVGMSSRLRKAYVAAIAYDVCNRIPRARHSAATAACSPANRSNGTSRGQTSFSDERELIPTDFTTTTSRGLALKRQPLPTYLYGLLPKPRLPERAGTG
jgi:hypothetical protein